MTGTCSVAVGCRQTDFLLKNELLRLTLHSLDFNSVTHDWEQVHIPHGLTRNFSLNNRLRVSEEVSASDRSPNFP